MTESNSTSIAKASSTTSNNLIDLMILLKQTDAEWPTDLPTFGGDEPENTDGIWSWDATHLLIGTCSDDLVIVAREEWGGAN